MGATDDGIDMPPFGRGGLSLDIPPPALTASDFRTSTPVAGVLGFGLFSCNAGMTAKKKTSRRWNPVSSIAGAERAHKAETPKIPRVTGSYWEVLKE